MLSFTGDGNDAVTDEEIKATINEWLCSQTKGVFYSNSFQQGEDSSNEFTLGLKCNVVEMEYKEDEIEFK